MDKMEEILSELRNIKQEISKIKEDIIIIKALNKYQLDEQNYTKYPNYSTDLETIIHRITKQDREIIREIVNRATVVVTTTKP